MRRTYYYPSSCNFHIYLSLWWAYVSFWELYVYWTKGDPQCTTTEFWCCGTSNHHTGLLIVYALVCLNHCYLGAKPHVPHRWKSQGNCCFRQYLLTSFPCWQSKVVVWSLCTFFVRALYASVANSIIHFTSTVAFIGAIVSQTLFGYTARSKPACPIQIIGIE